MTWNYRVVRHPIPRSKNTYLAIHECYYHPDGKTAAITKDPVQVHTTEDEGDGLRELSEQLMRMLEALGKPVLNVGEIGTASASIPKCNEV